MDQTSCASCGVIFGVPSGYLENRRKDLASFFCPNGHSLSYRESLLDKERHQRQLLEQKLAQKDDEIAEALANTAKIERKMKRLATKGVCPCCTRSFLNVKRHMATKHPAFMCDNPKPALKVVK